MKTIEVYQFNELSDEAKVNAISYNMSAVRKTVDAYLHDIWDDHLSEIATLLNCTVSVTISYWNVFTVISTYSLPVFTSADDVKYAIASLVKKAEETHFYFTEELKKAQSLYDGETYISFIRKFVFSLDVMASDWAIRVTDSPAFVLDCINGNVECLCCTEDLLPVDSNVYDADGNLIKIGK